jgi:thiol-disulfide isomerase/thioredoxin
LRGISQDGKVITLKDLKGKVIFIDMWSTGCPPCIKGIPHLLEMQKKFKERGEVEFVFLSGDDEVTWKKYLTNHTEFTGTHLLMRDKEDSQYNDNWKVTGIPRYILVDKQGYILDAFARCNEKLQKMIEKASTQ